MATNYRFGIRCWQDQAGDEDAKINVYLNGTKVVSEAAITGTDKDTDYNVISWESLGLGDTSSDTIITLKVELVNNLYVDANTDRNIYINGIGYIDQDPDGTYKSWRELASDSSETPDFTGADWETNEPVPIKIDTVTDFTVWDSYITAYMPTEVTSSSIASGWWDTAIAADAFHTIVIWGDETDGVTIKYKIMETRQSIQR